MKKIVSVTGALILAATISSTAFAGKMGGGNPFGASRGSFQGNTSMPKSTGQANPTGFMNGRQTNGQNGQMGGQINNKTQGQIGGRTSDQIGTHVNGQTGGRMM